jgi:hypothetical protein
MFGKTTRSAALPAVAAATVTAGTVGSPTALATTTTTARVTLPVFTTEWDSLRSQGGSATADTGPAAATAPIAARVHLASRDPRDLARYERRLGDRV